MGCQGPKGKKRAVLITGGAVRIGAAVAEALARAGWGVVVHARGAVAEAEALCGRLRALGAGAWHVRGDLARAGGGADVFAAACAAACGLDAVVNNAAVFSTRGAEGLTEEERLAMWRVNVEAPVELTRCLWDHLRGRGARGCAVQMLDQRVARHGVGEGATPYVRSKCALAAYVREAAAAMAPVLRVNAVAPGAVLAPVAPDAREPAGAFPLGQRPTPEQVADAVRWLLDAEAVTGQTVFVDGGQSLGMHVAAARHKG
ncbi:MAG: SDR family oxidoreductase [Kiritimatiellaeota bacterium]|nr:SDR family oxidoreductase [Kiritimatiellota bacterium]